MADNETPTTYDPEMERLNREIDNLKAAIAERAQDVKDAVRERSEVVLNNPGMVSASFIVGGIVGLLVGLALSESPRTDR